MSSPRLLSNRYELGDTLGYGGMSEVHYGHDVRLGREVAVKILRADLARDPQFQERFRREAQNAAALNHPAIVAVYDTGEAQSEYGPLPYIVMEYVDGRTLRDIVKTEGPLSQKRAMEVMADVCAALDFSHRHGIVHRDVKPANVMITEAGAVKVMDFGIARAIHDGQAAMTQTAAVIGTAQYLSPEQARGEAVDARSDVYAAGCVLFELVAGDPPFTGDSPVAVAYQHVREDPPPPSEINPTVSPELDAVVLKALAKGQANRYQSAAEMRSDLVRTLSGQRPSAPMVMTADDRTQAMNAAGDNDPYGYDDYGGPDDYYDAVDEARRQRKRRNRVAALLVALGVIAVAAVMWFAGVFGGNDEAVAIPNVMHKTEKVANDALKQRGFTNLAPTTYETCAPKPNAPQPCGPDDYGKVIHVDPDEGTPVSKNAKIALTVGKKPEMVQVPEVRNKTKEEAQQLLAQQGLLLDPQVVEVDTNDRSQYGRVITSEPEGGTTVEQGKTVKLTVGKTPKMVNLTDYSGRPYPEAKAALTALGFDVERDDVDSDQPKDTVISQRPSTGQQPEGSTVTLSVSNGVKQQITMPDVRDKTQDEAMSALKALGWSGRINTQTEDVADPADAGRVTNTDPASGTQITKDQTVTMYIGKASTPPSSPSQPPSSSSSAPTPELPIPGR